VIRLSLIVALAQAPDASESPTSESPTSESPATDPTGRWRFRDDEKPVKVVVLAGSIGAHPGDSYAKRLAQMCPRAEFKNISLTGLGAWALKRRFEHQVVDNRWIRPRRHPEHEYWLMFGGGLNSVALATNNNRHVRNLFVMAHAFGFRVVGLTLTPWGDDRDRRFRGASGLRYRLATQAVVDFMMGRLDPERALGAHAARRGDGPWDAAELPDIAVDLYDSNLRDRGAPPRDMEQMRALLARERLHGRARSDPQPEVLARDAKTLAELPQWYLRPELRSFDHIHPNDAGHELIATIVCPELPRSWGCACPVD
jgi:hypothetical protein